MPYFLFSRFKEYLMSLFGFFHNAFGEKSDLPIQVADDLSTFVEEKRPPRQGLTDSSVNSFTHDSMDDSSD
jgi:hypothetical protein